jgi:hypothetical protein
MAVHPGADGATADGKKDVIAIAGGYRDSEQSWKKLRLG